LSSTSLTSSPASSVFGHVVTFTATIDVNAPEHRPATGTVTFMEGANLLGTGVVNQVGGAFVATFTTSTLTSGSHSIKAAYSGDEAYISSSAVLNQTVTYLAPVATIDSYSGNHNITLSIAAPGVLKNDTDGDGHPLTAVLVSSPTHGTLTFNPNGPFSYVPASGYIGSDSFTYKANNGLTDSNVATVTLDFRFRNYLPSVVDNP
jgi:large repetitive protein